MASFRNSTHQYFQSVCISTLMGLTLFACLAFSLSHAVAGAARAIPSPRIDEAVKSEPALEVAVIAGGCFWGVQGIYQHVDGVVSAVSGYAGGEKATANYDATTRGTTGHAEAVKVTYDPRRITYGRILQVFFSVAHDPTQLNRQGPDVGTQYRSTIFPLNAEQAEVAKGYIAQLNQARAFSSAIATTIEPDRTFYPAEDYHQDFMFRNPAHPYIVVHDKPKLADLKRLFIEQYRAEPILVAGKSKH